MKVRLSTFVFLIIGLTSLANAQWTNIYNLPGVCAKDIEFTTSAKGYFVSNSIIGKTDDGGDTWELDTLDGISDLRIIDFIDPDTGLICCQPGGGDQDLWITFDGGNSWNDPLLSQGISLSDIDLVEGGNAIYSECLGFATNLTLAGNYYSNNIHTNYLPSASTCSDILFVNKNLGFTIGDFVTGDPFIPTVYKTIDGGLSWYSHENMYGPLYYITFSTEEVGYGIGYESRVWKTNDSGESWEMLPFDFGGYDVFDVNLSLGKIYFYSDSIGLLQLSKKVDGVDMPGIYRTINGGESWYKTDLDISNNQLYDFYCTSSDTCFAATCGALFRTYNGGGIDTLDLGVNNFETISNVEIYPNPASECLYIDYNVNPKDISIRLYNITGELIRATSSQSFSSFANRIKIDLLNITPGIYTVLVTEDGSTIRAFRFVKN